MLNLRKCVKVVRDRTPLGAVACRATRALKRMGLPVSLSVGQHLPYHGVVQARAGGGTFRMRSMGHTIENGLYWEGLGGREKTCLAAWVALSQAPGLVLDVGSNTGLFSLATCAARPGAAVVAFEPLPRVAEMLRANVAMNPGFAIEVREEAVSDTQGEVSIHDPGGDQPSSASLLEDFLPVDTRPITVPMTTLDAATAGRTVGLAKIDVEGVEDRVLRGMAGVIERDRPALVVEVLDDRPQVTDEVRRLEGLGYRTYDLAAAGAEEMTGAFHVPRDRNLLLIPEARHDELKAVAGFSL